MHFGTKSYLKSTRNHNTLLVSPKAYSYFIFCDKKEEVVGLSIEHTSEQHEQLFTTPKDLH